MFETVKETLGFRWQDSILSRQKHRDRSLRIVEDPGLSGVVDPEASGFGLGHKEQRDRISMDLGEIELYQVYSGLSRLWWWIQMEKRASGIGIWNTGFQGTGRGCYLPAE